MIDREKLLNSLKCLASDNNWCEIDRPYDNCPYYGRNCAKMMARDALKLLKEQPQWISVDDALPEEHGDYLAIIDGQVKPVVFDYTRRWAHYTYKGIVVDDNITHWMQLPKGVKSE